MWNLYENEKELKPLVFSNGKSQEDIVKEVFNIINQGYKIIFIRGICGTGKSAIALNLARKLGKTSVIVPIKSLQEQYIKDYSNKKYVLNKGKKLKIFSVVGRQNFKCKFLKENKTDLIKTTKEKNAKLFDIFENTKPIEPEKDKSCNNKYLPCKIELKEKNLPIIKKYIKQNPSVDITDFDSIKEVKRMTIAPICPYWSPILPDEFELRKFKNANKIKYMGLNNRGFTIYQREAGCPYYDQYLAYRDADVIIFNSLKYKLETLMNRKPETEVEIIDECDEFLDSFSNQEQININRLLFALSTILPENKEIKKASDKLRDITNAIKISKKYNNTDKEIFRLKNSLVQELLETILENPELIEDFESETNYLNHLDEVARIFYDFFDEAFFSIEKKDKDLIINIITTNLEKRFNELLEKNKIFILMSGTVHSESVLKNIFGLDNFKIIDAETQHQGQLIKCRNGYEMDCSYNSFQSKRTTREAYLKALSKSIQCAKLPVLVQVNSFSDLPTDFEKHQLNLENLPTQYELINRQSNDPLGQRVIDFKNKKTKILFTTKCSRGIDFPGEICNSIVVTRFPYPDISSIFWKILKQTEPVHFMSFYMDKAHRELLQRIYRGLRSKTDRIYLLSPDIRVLDFNIN